MCSRPNINSQFLLGMLLEENKHLNPIDFIDKTDKATDFSCICVSLSIAEKYREIKDCFIDMNLFFSTYFDLYATALDNYRSIVGQSLRQVYLEEAKIFHQLDFDTFTTNNLVTDALKKKDALELFDTIRNNNSYAIILRDDIAFVVIHYNENDFILIDPHVEYCGILSSASIYRYIVYDNAWNFDVHVMVPKIENTVQESAQAPLEDTLELVQESVQEPIQESTQAPLEDTLEVQVQEPVESKIFHVYLVEPTSEQKIDASTIKKFTGGDTISEKSLGDESTVIKPTFKPVLLCNDLPLIRQ